MDDDQRKRINADWADALKRNVEGIKDSGSFISMLNGHFDDPLMLMQIGIAMMLDKPICLLVNKDTPIPKNMKRVAKLVEVVDFADEAAMLRAVKRITDATP